MGPIIAARLIGYAGDVGRFANRDAYASYNGTAPVELLLGRPGRAPALAAGQPQAQPCHPHGRRSPRSAIPALEGRIYFERKVAEGKTKKEALRSLKRQISNAVYRQLLLDAR